MTEPVNPKRSYNSPAPPRAGGSHPAGDPRGRPAALRAAGLRGDDDGGDRDRGRRRAEDRLSWPSRPRAASCGRSGTCSYAATRRTSPVAERGWYRETLDEPDPERQLRSTRATRGPARNGSAPSARRFAPPPPPTPRSQALWDRIQSDYYENQRPDRREPPAQERAQPRSRRRRATDILWTINHPTVWQLLVLRQGWTPERYEEWCVRTACSQLLAGHGE